MTPEGKVKAKIDELLAKYPVYVFKPVQFGLGAAGLDYHCVIKIGDTSVAFFIEAKKPGGEPTVRQKELIGRLRRDFRCNVFAIDSVYDIHTLKDWLDKVARAADNETTTRVHR